MTSSSIKRFLSIIGEADEIDGVGKMSSDTQRVFMTDDITLLDTKTTDYNGRACLIKGPEDDRPHYLRVFIDGDTVTAVCTTDGDTVFTANMNEVKIYGAVVGIVRKLEPEERQDGSAWDEFTKVAFPGEDHLSKYYPINEKYYVATRQHERGGAYGMFFFGYHYGFERGRKAQKAENRRKHRAKKRKEAPAHD